MQCTCWQLLVGDIRLACEAILCLSSGDRRKLKQ
ncbi:TrbM/KikA/MpfK family conjugal transfer protein, partial [Kingella kingae]